MNIDPKEIAKLISEYPDGDIGRFGTGGPVSDPDDEKYPVMDALEDDVPTSANDLKRQRFTEKSVRCFTDNAGIYFFLIDGQWMPLRTD